MSPSVEQSLENQLVAQVQSAAVGDVDAFSQLVNRTSSTVCSIALAIVRDVSASEDIAQEVYLGVWKGLKKLNNPKSFLPWLRQLTRNQAHTWLRQRYAHRVHQRVSEKELEAVSDSRSSAEASLEQQESLNLLAQALEDLPEETREVMVLYYREGQSSAQVAELLNLSPAAVRKRLQRARKALRQDVAERLRRGLERSAPTAAWIGSVVAMTTITTAPAQAAVLSGATAKGAGGLLKITGLAAVSGALLGGLSGIGGVIFGLRSEFAQALDSREIARLKNLRNTAVGSVIVACLGFVWSARFHHWLPPTLVYLAFLLSLFVIYFLWLPRIVEDRLAYQRATDPKASEQHLHRRRWSIIGFIGGGLTGGAGLLAGLWSSGLLP